jgi:hypothetical protein
MRQRCLNPKSDSYHKYGARGISICERWNVFENFLSDMGPRPSPRHSIDRIDNNGNYEPGNCRWATIDQQSYNKRSNILISALGITLHLKKWSDRTGISATTIRNRLKKGWPTDMAVSAPSARREIAKMKEPKR